MIILKNILLIEDDNELAEYLCEFLYSEGYTVKHGQGQTDGLDIFKNNIFDCVLLDVTLQDGNGFLICSEIRAHSDVPIIFLTASGDELYTVAGFEMGADDYINKPFRPRELIARIKNAVRRKVDSTQDLNCGDISVDTTRGVVLKSGSELFLSALEYRLLLIFISNKGVLMSRDRLIDELWNASGEYVSDNTLTVYIKRLREKIEQDPQNPAIIKTVRGAGYKAGD